MRIDPTRFHLLNVADSCSIWNVLSSRLLLARALGSGCSFCCTQFVEYECLFKRRTRPTKEDDSIKERLLAERKKGHFKAYALEIEDLQDVNLLQTRKSLSLGELSSIAFAKKTNQAFLTDDQKARRLAEKVLPLDRVQTVPHLFGWLLFGGVIQDGDKDQVIREHSDLGRPLSRFFEDVYHWILQLRLARHTSRE